MSDREDFPSSSEQRTGVARIEDLFSYHPPDPNQIPKYNAIREAAKAFALVLHENCPQSADRSAAMRKLQDCVMTANRSIALKGRGYR